MNEDFQTNIIHWLEYDNKIASLKTEIKKLQEKKQIKEDNLTQQILQRDLTGKSIKIPSYNSLIKYNESHVFDNLSFKLLKESLDECICNPELVEKIINHTRNKRGKKSKISIKRDMI